MYNPLEAHPVRRAGDYEELGTSGNSFEEPVSNYFSYGISSALTSAGVGLWNTGSMLLNTFGADIKYASEEAVNRDLFGKDSGDFYARHKIGADVTGMIVSSFGVGLGAVKALRMAQGAGKMTLGMEAATGLKNPVDDIVLGSRQVQVAKEAALANPVTFSWNNAQTWNAIGVGFRQNLAEAFVFDTAVGLTHAGNIVINPDKKDYFSSLGEYASDTYKWTLGGAALGGAITGLQIKGAIKAAYAEKTVENARFTNISADLPQYGNSGDMLTMGFSKLSDLWHSPEYSIEAGDKFAQTRKFKAEEQVTSYLKDVFTQVNKAGEEGLLEFDRAISSLRTGPKPLDKIAEEFAAIRQINHISVTDLGRLNTFYAKTVSPNIHVVGKDFSDIMDQMRGMLKAGTREDYHGVVDLAVDQYSAKLFSEGFGDFTGTGGWSSGNQELMQSIRKKLLEDGISTPPSLTTGKSIGGVSATNIGEGARYSDYALERLQRVDEMLVNAGLLKQPVFGNMSPDQFHLMTQMHEITHFKTNGKKALDNVVWHMSRNTEFAQEIEKFSRSKYPFAWDDFDASVEALVKQGYTPERARFVIYNGNKKLRIGGLKDQYHLSPAELISQTAELMMHPDVMKEAAKMAPKTSAFFNKFGAFIKPFDEKITYKNVRTGEEYSGVLPLPQDVGKVSLLGDTVRVDNINVGFKYSTDFFNPKMIEKLYVRADEFQIAVTDKTYLKAAAQFAAIAKQSFTDFTVQVAGKDGTYLLHKHDLPRIEKLLTELAKPEQLKDFEKQGRKIQLNMSDTDIPKLVEYGITDLKDYLIKAKQELRFQMNQTFHMNEWEIAHSLNMEVKAAAGITDAASVEGNLLTMGSRNYDRPEHIVARYVPSDIKEVDVNTRTLVAANQRMNMLRELQMRSSAEIIGGPVSLLPSAETLHKALGQLDETATRASGFTSTRGNIGKSGLREIAQYVGRIVRNIKSDASQAIEENFSRHYGVFNKPENYKLRAELALATNKMYEGWHNTFKLQVDDDAYEHLLISLDDLAQHTSTVEGWALAAGNGDLAAKKQLELLTSTNKFSGGYDIRELGLLLAMQNRKTTTLQKEVFDFFEETVKPFNQEVARKHHLIAQGKGMSSSYRTDIIYPPPRDLRKFPHVAFVLPKPALDGADNGRYMLFGRSAKELETKLQVAREKYGDTHNLVTSEQVEQHKKLIGEYDKGDVFDEWFFDPTITRKGRTAEATPSLDIEASEVLDRFRNWQHKTSESQIMSGVELMYNDVFHALERADESYGRAARSAITGRTERATIFEDTKNLMLDKSSRQGVGMEMYKKISGIVSDKGGQVIDAVVNKLGRTASSNFTEAQFQQMNKELEAAGFNPPYTDMMRAIIASPDTSNSRSMELAIRTLNNLVGTFQLRLDIANSILQTISTPILALPVIREAMRNSQAVHDMLHVHNPALGLKEPSPMKLFARAIKTYWSPEGKQFLSQMKGRGIVTDYLKEYLEAQDFSSLTGRHSLKAVNDAITKVGDFGSKWSAHRFSEEFSRYLVAASVKDVANLRGLSEGETWAMVSNAVDAVHGIYRSHQRPQVFNGVIGQAIGMYQTYFFNWAQNALRFVERGDRKNAMIMAAMQANIFGIRSLPGFTTFNNMVAETNSGNMDLYTLTNADDPKSWGAWVLYGTGSHAFLHPADLASRGDVVMRNSLVLPTQIQDLPTVSILSNVMKNAWNTLGMITENDTNAGQALLFGLAHNGLSRPLQGLGTAVMGQVTTQQGTPLFHNSNYTDYDTANELNLGMISTRIIGTRPLEEAIMMDNMYRTKAYQAAAQEKTAEIGKEIKLAISGGNVSSEDWNDFAERYESAGGKIENFNRFAARMLSVSSKSEVEEFRRNLEVDSPLRRMQDRLLIEREPISPDE